MIDFRLGDAVRLRKVHPCGGYDWEVVRIGADVGIKCLTCGRKVVLSRRELEKRTRRVTPRGAAAFVDTPQART